MAESIAAIMVVATMLLAAYGAGCMPFSRVAPTDEDHLSHISWSVCVGLAVYGMFFLLIGLAGILFQPLIAAATLAGGLWGARELFDRFGSPEKVEPLRAVAAEASPAPAAWFARPAIWLAGLCCAAALVGALAPPTAGDALCYHLQLPKEFLAANEIAFSRDSENSTFPLLTEMWFLWALALDGGVSAQTFAWSLGVLLASAATLLARPYLGTRNAWAVGAIVLLTPGVTNQMAAPLNDVALALFTTMAIVAWREKLFEEAGWRWAALSGAMWGCAFSIKYVAFLALGAVAAATIWKLVRDRENRGDILKALAVSGAIAIAISGTWYARAIIHRGNPVYPFFEELAGRSDRSSLPASKAKLGRTPMSLLAAPWELTMYPEKFGGRGAQFGAIFLLTAPALLTARRLRGLKLLGGIILAYAVLWIALRQNLRFALPILPLLAIGAAWSLMEMSRFPRGARLAAQGIALTVFALTTLIPCARAARTLAVTTGFESRQAYLTREEPTRRALSSPGATSLRDAHVLSQDYRGFYFPCKFTREVTYRKRTRYDEQIAKPGDLRELLGREGFTHVLLAESKRFVGPTNDETLARLVDAEIASYHGAHWETLADYDFTDREGATRRYRLLQIK